MPTRAWAWHPAVPNFGERTNDRETLLKSSGTRWEAQVLCGIAQAEACGSGAVGDGAGMVRSGL